AVPIVRPQAAKALMDALSQATRSRLVRACHDLSEGGLGVALAEMAFAGGLGARVFLDKVPLGEAIAREDYILFSESNSRFLVEIAPRDREKFERIMGDSPLATLGYVNGGQSLEIYGLKDNKVVDEPISELKEAWQKTFRW
ncbi:MAG: AIR synthase-related protein, partial [Dehalococcoidales bacterium]